MTPLELTIGIRNILLVQLVMIVLIPIHFVLVRQELIRLWKSINAPFLVKRNRKKGNSFWVIDMTKFEL